MDFELIDDKIAFTFIEDIQNRGFANTTESGIIVQESHENQMKHPRWGIVKKCAPSVSEVQEGDTILIEPLGWTNVMETDGEDFWVTTESRIMAVDS